MKPIFQNPGTLQKSLPEKANAAVCLMNKYGKARRPFLFIIDFLMQQPVVIPLDLIGRDKLLYDVCGETNAFHEHSAHTGSFRFKMKPPAFARYKRAFDLIMQQLRYGNSYLLNLTMPTELHCDLSLKDIFYRSNAAYKLWFDDRFVLFSPELFVRITHGRIESHPMKGTIDASLPGAEARILNDPKEAAEHNTIVDLIRNDMNRIAQNIRVEQFRYITPVVARNKTLLQVSSSVVGELDENYHEEIGSIIFSLLPAGSISGAPKKKTVEIILEAEQYERGYYTGVFGLFDGHDLDSGVMIRYIEKTGNRLWYKSGGGITVNSRCKEEYQELIDKVYLPFA